LATTVQAYAFYEFTFLKVTNLNEKTANKLYF